MPEYLYYNQALPLPQVLHIKENILASPLLGPSPLAGTFRESRGFALTFRRDGIAELTERFGFLRPFLHEALLHAPSLWPWHTRVGRRYRGTPNAFYLNVLMLGAQTSVGAHVDATLRAASCEPLAVPSLVSVLYLEVPKALGGELILARGAKQRLTLRPKVGGMLHFRGDLLHSVQPFAASSDLSARRLSLVCEQYALSKSGLAHLAPLRVHSKAGFAAYLQAQRSSGVVSDVIVEKF